MVERKPERKPPATTILKRLGKYPRRTQIVSRDYIAALGP